MATYKDMGIADVAFTADTDLTPYDTGTFSSVGLVLVACT